MTKKKAAVWIILFALMITGPRVIYYFAEPHISEENTENRQLAEKPALTRDNLYNYASPVSYTHLTLPTILRV